MLLETQARIELNRHILGGSSPLAPGEGTPSERYLMHTKEHLEPLVEGAHVVFVPYASSDMDAALGGLEMGLRRMGARTVVSLHQFPGSEESVTRDAEVLYIGGGSTGRLVANLHALRNEDRENSFVDTRPDASRTSLVSTIRNKVADGTPLVGFSAGLNVMSDTRTTNDMASAVQGTRKGLVVRLDALGLFPSWLSFNPHYPPKVEGEKTEYMGEDRDERIAPIIEVDPSRVVLALREGAYVVVKGMEMILKGTMGGVIFRADKNPQPVENGDNLSDLLIA